MSNSEPRIVKRGRLAFDDKGNPADVLTIFADETGKDVLRCRHLNLQPGESFTLGDVEWVIVSKGEPEIDHPHPAASALRWVSRGVVRRAGVQEGGVP